MRVVHAGPALVVALEEERMTWIVTTSAAQALASFVVGYGVAAVIIGRQNPEAPCAPAEPAVAKRLRNRRWFWE